MIVAIGILHNLTDQTYHPILFRDAPLPGPLDDDSPRRLRSRGHHTTGFSDVEAAKEHVSTFENDEVAVNVVRSTERLIPWDGEGVPATTVFLVGEELVFM